MFQMDRIGRKISQLRKERNMTQMELADRLNISFQAVSNWERGQSMPDIAKLGEISELLGVTIDDLLENKRNAQVIQAIQAGTALPEPLAQEELIEVAPLLKPRQMERIVSEMKERIDFSEITSLLPFLSEEMIGEMARECYERHGLAKEIVALAPFMDEDVLSGMVKQAVQDGKDMSELSSFYPFISGDALQAYAEKQLEQTGNLNSITNMAPFLKDDYINELAKRFYEKNGLQSIICLAPFIDEDTLNDIAREVLNRDGLKGLGSIMPFIDESIVEDYIRQRKPYLKQQ